MSRAKRSMKRRQFRFSLDPMDPVEGEALRQIDEIAEEAKEMFGEISQEEADRYAFKRILLGLLKDRPVELSVTTRVAHVPASAPATPAPAAVPQPEAQPVPPSQPLAAPEKPSVAADEGEQGTASNGSQTTGGAAPAITPDIPEPSWHEQLINPEAAKAVPSLNNLVWAGTRPVE